MKIYIDKENNSISVPTREIAGFARTRSGNSRLAFAECSTDSDIEEAQGRELSYRVSEGDMEFTVVGFADALYPVSGVWTLEKYAQRTRITSRTSPASDVQLMADAVLSAYMLAAEKNLECVRVKLTFVSPRNVKSFETVFKTGFLKNMSSALLSRAVPFIKIEAEKRICGISSLENMMFPYREMRGAQKDFISDAYRVAKRGGRLLVSAPTGIGKTVSALYPALRALGQRHADKIFYLTAKTVTGNAAADACRVMSSQVPTLKCINIIAKERLCPVKGAGHAAGGCRICPLLGEVGRVPYEERRDEALLEILQNYRVIDASTVAGVAKKYELCPYELSLDASEYCEVIICDYNYAFDPSVRFRRYFTDSERERGKYIFLVDEAHNLPDRARSMYSASIDAAVFIKLYRSGAELFSGNAPLLDGIGAVVGRLKELSDLCRTEEKLDAGGRSIGCYLSSSMPSGLTEALSRFIRAAGQTAAADGDDAAALEDAMLMSAEFLRSAALFDRGFVLYCEQVGARLTVSIRCLDPSPIIDNMLSAAKAAVLFSATLTPMDYFADVLGCKNAVKLELDSPYDPSNLCLFAYDSISTRYTDREMYCDDIAEVIMSVAEARDGNYMVYFPSYEYMNSVYKAFAEIAPDIHCAVQSKGMSYAERNRFLEQFSDKNGETLVGFCVLGGAFAEGVDLKGEKLIGTVIVGTGLPKISAELNILSDYFENTRENGKDYAYTYPAMIKVEQAAGRVIRSESDCGVVVLIDDRYAEPGTYRLFPKSWRHIKYTGDPYSLNSALCKFWESKG